MRLMVSLLISVLLLVGIWSSSQTAAAAQPEWTSTSACEVSWPAQNGDWHGITYPENVEIEFRSNQGRIDKMRLPDERGVIPIGLGVIAISWCAPTES